MGYTVDGLIIFFGIILTLFGIGCFIWFVGSINRITRSNENLELYLKYLVSLISKKEAPDFDEPTYQDIPGANDKAVPDYRLMAEINMHKDKND